MSGFVIKRHSSTNLKAAACCRWQVSMRDWAPRFASIALLSAVVGPVVVRSQTNAAPPIDGVLGKVETVKNGSFDVQTKTGLVHVKIGRPLTTYKQVPSELSQVTANSYVGIATVEQPNGTEVAQSVLIFPPELKGAAEGSVITGGGQGTKSESRMTNGSVSRVPAHTSRMTNGTVQTDGGPTLVVNYQHGSQRISVPASVPVHKVAPVKGFLAPGDIVYAATKKEPDGALATNKVFLFVEAAPQSPKN